MGCPRWKPLNVSNNDIETLPAGIFEGLGSLTEVNFASNAAPNGFVLTPELKRVDDSTFQVDIIEGAPFNTSATLNVLGGTLSASTVSLSGGNLSSAQVTITREQSDDVVGITLTGAIFSTGTAEGLRVLGYRNLNLPRPTITVVDSDTTVVNVDPGSTTVSVVEGNAAQVTLNLSPTPVVEVPIWLNMEYDHEDFTTPSGGPDDHRRPRASAYDGDSQTTAYVPIFNDSDIDDSAQESLLLVVKEDPDGYAPYVVGDENEAIIVIKEGVCDRTGAVQTAILSALNFQSHQCTEVTDDNLASIVDPFDLSGGPQAQAGDGVASLKSRDFLGLTALTGLDLANATMASLPSDVFAGLGSLTSLSLGDGTLTSLDAGVFNQLSALQTLDVSDNALSALPGGIFVGLGSLSSVDFSGNTGAPFALATEFVLKANNDPAGTFKVALRMSDGAPGAVAVSLSAANASPGSMSTSLGSGATEISDAAFTWTTGDATISIARDEANVMTGLSSSATGHDSITFQAPTDLVVENPTPTTTVTPTVSITTASLTVVEGATAEIQFQLSAPAPKDFTLHYRTRDDTDNDTVDASETGDYTASGTQLVEENDQSGTISVTITDDTEIDEGMLEVFVVELVLEDGEPYLIDTSQDESTVTINDGICDRAQVVQNAIIGELTGNLNCHEITEANLNGVTGEIDFPMTLTPVTLQSGEFKGLTSLVSLRLSKVNLSPGLPSGLFEDLDSLETLRMCFSSIQSVEAGDFAGLGNLTRLYMDNNQVDSLPANVFADTPKLIWLYLYYNGISSIDGDAFNDATKIKYLKLQNNDLTELPDGMFEGLTDLRTLYLSGNDGSPFNLKPSVTDEGDGSFVVRFAKGAPYDVSVPVTVTGGTMTGSSVAVEAGSLASSPVSVTWDAGNIGTVTVAPGQPTWVDDPDVTRNFDGIGLVSGDAATLEAP